MTIFKIEDLLTNIRDRFATVANMCETFNTEAEPEKYSEFVLKRAEILDNIEKQELELNSNNGECVELCNTNSNLAKLRNEIIGYLTTVLALDETIKQQFNQKIGETRQELSSLGSSAKAAMSYARH